MNNINQLHYNLHLIVGGLKQFEKQLQNMRDIIIAINFETISNQKVPNASFNSIFEFLKIQIDEMETFLKENKQ
jgi:hypothetical protein